MNSGAFDCEWYIKKYRLTHGMDPIQHYNENFFGFGTQTSRFFDGEWYLLQYPDVKEAGIDPLIHYAFYGKTERRMPGIPECIRTDLPRYIDELLILSADFSDTRKRFDDGMYQVKSFEDEDNLSAIWQVIFNNLKLPFNKMVFVPFTVIKDHTLTVEMDTLVVTEKNDLGFSNVSLDNWFFTNDHLSGMSRIESEKIMETLVYAIRPKAVLNFGFDLFSSVLLTSSRQIKFAVDVNEPTGRFKLHSSTAETYGYLNKSGAILKSRYDFMSEKRGIKLISPDFLGFNLSKWLSSDDKTRLMSNFGLHFK
ncbi:hypothetical protein [Methylobacterium brachiatum]|uniref:hypothetical protein n=1 Tax=Methylobacterium brachiatum TaxID=269660 RepID=UPI003315103E